MRRIAMVLLMVNFCLSVYFGGDMTEWIAFIYVMSSFYGLFLGMTFLYPAP